MWLSIDESTCGLGLAHNWTDFPSRTPAGPDLWPRGLSGRAEQLAIAAGELAAGCAAGLHELWDTPESVSWF